MTHTPGPWQVNSGMVETVAGIPIAWMDREPNNGTMPTERDANAKLIAVAPKLLEALRDALKALEVANIAGQSLYASAVTEKVRVAIREVDHP